MLKKNLVPEDQKAYEYLLEWSWAQRGWGTANRAQKKRVDEFMQKFLADKEFRLANHLPFELCLISILYAVGHWDKFFTRSEEAKEQFNDWVLEYSEWDLISNWTYLQIFKHAHFSAKDLLKLTPDDFWEKNIDVLMEINLQETFFMMLYKKDKNAIIKVLKKWPRAYSLYMRPRRE